MIAATFPDLDGLSRLAGQQAYWDWHHIVFHNLTAGLVVSVLLAAFSARRYLGLAVYFGLFHLHLVLDYFGSGPGWGFAYWWPFSRAEIYTWDFWEFYSWQNISAEFLFLGGTIFIAFRQKRTPLEVLMPSLDKQLVQLTVGKKHRSAEQRAGR
jgi:hypothetical protein